MDNYVITSRLKAWEGTITLPHPDDMRRSHWELWRAGIEKPKRKSYSTIHLYCYAGLELIRRYGEWNMSVSLEEVASWEDRPDDERVKLVAWIGRELIMYVNGVMDPKE